jgi:hypothetical protein
LLAAILLALAPAFAGTSAYDEARAVFLRVTSVRYRHVKAPALAQVDGDRAWDDCSGFVSWVVDRVSPSSYEAVRALEPSSPHPHARTYALFFSRLGNTSPRDGWIGIRSWRDLRRGDFIAWEKGARAEDHGGGSNSGHVMMVVDRPGAVTVRKGLRFVAVFVLDSSSVSHFRPEILPPRAGQARRDGLGEGTVRLVLDRGDRVVGYWEGTWWGEGRKRIARPSYSERVAFGRLVVGGTDGRGSE